MAMEERRNGAATRRQTWNPGMIAMQALSLLAVMVAVGALMLLSSTQGAAATASGLIFPMLLGIGSLIICLAFLVEIIAPPAVDWPLAIRSKQRKARTTVIKIRLHRSELEPVGLDTGRVVASY